MNKTYAAWESTKMWCLANPEKKAAIAGPQGMFTITFTPFTEPVGAPLLASPLESPARPAASPERDDQCRLAAFIAGWDAHRDNQTESGPILDDAYAAWLEYEGYRKPSSDVSGP